MQNRVAACHMLAGPLEAQRIGANLFETCLMATDDRYANDALLFLAVHYVDAVICGHLRIPARTSIYAHGQA